MDHSKNLVSLTITSFYLEVTRRSPVGRLFSMASSITNHLATSLSTTSALAPRPTAIISSILLLPSAVALNKLSPPCRERATGLHLPSGHPESTGGMALLRYPLASQEESTPLRQLICACRLLGKKNRSTSSPRNRHQPCYSARWTTQPIALLTWITYVCRIVRRRLA